MPSGPFENLFFKELGADKIFSGEHEMLERSTQSN